MYCKKMRLFLSFRYVCPDCLGKMIVFSIKWRKKTRFLTSSQLATPPAPVSAAVGMASPSLAAAFWPWSNGPSLIAECPAATAAAAFFANVLGTRSSASRVMRLMFA
jgi:hypothetical protein